MTKVFIGGSRSLSRLSPTVKARADNIIARSFTVLIGDANGMDKAVQSYLADKGYKNVIVYCAGERCRNNIGQWETKFIETGEDHKGFDYYAVKDMEMAKDASYGFMIWDGKSRGTLNNIINLLNLEKRVLVYFSPENHCYTLKSCRDIMGLLNKCDDNARIGFEKYFSLAECTAPQQVPLKFEHSSTDK